MQATAPTTVAMRWRFKKKYGSSKRISAVTKLELMTLTVPRISSTAMMPSTASMSFCQKRLRWSGGLRSGAVSCSTSSAPFTGKRPRSG